MAHPCRCARLSSRCRWRDSSFLIYDPTCTVAPDGTLVMREQRSVVWGVLSFMLGLFLLTVVGILTCTIYFSGAPPPAPFEGDGQIVVILAYYILFPIFLGAFGWMGLKLSLIRRGFVFNPQTRVLQARVTLAGVPVWQPKFPASLFEFVTLEKARNHGRWRMLLVCVGAKGCVIVASCRLLADAERLAAELARQTGLPYNPPGEEA